MERRPLVVLVGDSVLIDSVSASLEEKGVPGVIHLNVPSVDVHKRLGDLKPDLVVFELDSPYTSPVYTLLREHPGIRLVGLDLNDSSVIVISSHQHTTHSMGELAHVVHTQQAERSQTERRPNDNITG